jgi:hypothetical protein
MLYKINGSERLQNQNHFQVHASKTKDQINSRSFIFITLRYREHFPRYTRRKALFHLLVL